MSISYARKQINKKSLWFQRLGKSRFSKSFRLKIMALTTLYWNILIRLTVLKLRWTLWLLYLVIEFGLPIQVILLFCLWSLQVQEYSIGKIIVSLQRWTRSAVCQLTSGRDKVLFTFYLNLRKLQWYSEFRLIFQWLYISTSQRQPEGTSLGLQPRSTSMNC